MKRSGVDGQTEGVGCSTNFLFYSSSLVHSLLERRWRSSVLKGQRGFESPALGVFSPSYARHSLG